MPDLSSVIGQELSSVEFLQDHLVLHFDGPTLTLYTWPDVFREEGSYAYGEPEYRNVLCAVLSTSTSLIEMQTSVPVPSTIRSSLNIFWLTSASARSIYGRQRTRPSLLAAGLTFSVGIRKSFGPGCL